MNSFFRFVILIFMAIVLTVVGSQLYKKGKQQIKAENTYTFVKNSLEGQKYFHVFTTFGDQIEEAQRDSLIVTGEGDIIINYDGSYFNVNFKEYYVNSVTRVRY